ncbi:MAG: nucleoside recognition domain-containing protein [Rikenellaceae bacterium]
MKKNIVIVKEQIVNSVKPTIKSAIWLLKMMIPIMLLVSVLDYYGIVAFVSQYTAPLFNMMGLEGNAAFVFITSCLSSIYSAIGVMAMFGFDFRSVLIMASMCLIAHNLIIEGTIQSKSGTSFWGITLLRICSSLMCGYLLNFVVPVNISGNLMLNAVTVKPETFVEMITMWAEASLMLVVKVLIVVYLLNVLQNLLKVYKIIDLLIKYLSPLIAILGLPKSTSFLWIVANSLGLAYGGAVIVEEIAKGKISKSDASLLHTSISQTHSLIEDTALFATMGIGLGWLILPRMILSICTVWVQKTLRIWVRKRSRRYSLSN